MAERIDLHCHIVPYVDDGAQDFDEALELLRELHAQGVTCVCATPHLRAHMFETPDEEVRKRFDQLQEKLNTKQLPIHLCLSREYHCDREFFKRLEQKTLIPMGKSGTILCEFSHVSEAAFIADTVQKVLDAGYKPLIAHAERYETIHKSSGLIARLKKMGAKIQVNADALAGSDGFSQKLFCRKLAKDKLIDVVGSDAHDPVSRPPRLDVCAQWLVQKCGVAYARKIMYENPLEILTGQPAE